jgi:flagellar protein FliS
MDEPAMSTAARNHYVAAEVLTAPPQKLQAMLIEAAIRASEQARALWRENDEAGAAEALERARRIIGEILAGFDRQAAPELVAKVSSVYLYLFRTLGEAAAQRNEQKLDDALRVLRVERDTWRRLCEKLAGDPPPAAAKPTFDAAEITESPGFSLEA